jgi:hypothetical protein
LLCQLAALGMRDRGFKPTLGSAAFEHLAAMLLLLFVLGFSTVLRKWERGSSPATETPASDGAHAAALVLALSLLAASAARIAAFESKEWEGLAFALDKVCLLPLVALVPFVLLTTLAPGAPTGFALAGVIVGVAGLARAAALLVDDERSIFARDALTGGIAFALFVIWIAVGGFLALRVKEG